MGTASGAWIAHLYTALGAGTALAATLAVFAGEFRQAFLWLAVGLFIDSTDGVLARAVRVKERLPWIRRRDARQRRRLPDLRVRAGADHAARRAVARRRGGLGSASRSWSPAATGSAVPTPRSTPIDYAFTGFPSYWNIVAHVPHAWRLSPAVNAAVVAVLVALVFVPIRYVYPSRTRTWQPVTLALGAAWAVITAVVLWRLPAVDGPWLVLSLVFPAYYAVLSLWLTWRERRGR